MTTIVADSNTISADRIFNLQLNTKLTLTAAEARKLVNHQVIPTLGTGLVAVIPELVIIEKQLLWRVPIKLSLPHWGDLGQVGYVMVDALSGQLLFTEQTQERIITHARWLYQGATLSTK